MRKITGLLLAVITAVCLHTTVYADNIGADTLKVGLFYGSTAQKNINISSDSGFRVGIEADGQFVEQYVSEQAEITVTAAEDGSVAVGEEIFAPESFPTLYPVSGYIKIDGSPYRGGVQFKRINGGGLTVINVVNIEEYLYSVIGSEMSPSWNIEALKAQAVCARGFAISNKNKFASYGFNLDNSTNSQVYVGMAKETESTRRAVDETRGQVLMHSGKIIESIYCSSMGGASANAENVWGGRYPYLVSVVDPYENPNESPRYAWSITLTAEEIKNCLANAGVNIGDITNVQITNRDGAGYVLELRFTGTAGTHTVQRSNCRNIFGGKIHSQRYTIQSNGSSAPTTLRSTGGISVLGWISKALGVEGFEIKLPEPAAPKPVQTANEYTFNGNGWGHGVGMSQWGAKGMADQGFTYSDILTFYYTGTYIENVY